MTSSLNMTGSGTLPRDQDEMDPGAPSALDAPPPDQDGTEVEIRGDFSSRVAAIPLRDLVRSLRPRQWVKNLFVLAPLVFSKNLMDRTQFGLAVLAFVTFCLLSGVVYIINDIQDVEADRRHVRKRRRPIASGRLPVESAKIAAAGIAILALAAAFVIDWRFGLVSLGYLLLNGGYSRWLKHVAYVDVLCVATGFLLRVVAGALAIDVAVSHWLILCAFLLALFLAIGKRRHEHRLTAGSGETRKVLMSYKAGHLEVVSYVVGGLTLTMYLAYTLSSRTRAFFETDLLPASTPFIAFGLWRFLDIVDATSAESPTDAILKDPPFMVNLAFWSSFIVMAIYFQP